MSGLSLLNWPLLVWFLGCAAAGLLAWNRIFLPRLDPRWAAVLLVALAPVAPLARADLVYGPFDTNARLLPWADAADLARRPHNGRLNDLTLQAIPWQTEARRQLLAGRPPLLNPYSGAGQPLLPNAQVASYVSLLALPFEPLVAQPLRVLLVLWLALTGSFLAARQLGCAPPAAVLGAVAYAYGGSLTVWRLFPHTEVMALFPYAVLASERLLAAPDERAPRALFVVALAGIGLAGHPETAFTAALALASRWLFALLWERRDRARRRGVGVLLLCSGLAVAGVAHFILPMAGSVLASEKLAHEGWGGHEGWTARPRSAANEAAASVGGLLTLAVPGVFGTPQGAGEAGPAPLHWLVEGSVGIIALALAPGALLGVGRRSETTSWLALVAAFGLALHLDPGGLFARLSSLPLLSVLARRYFAYLAAFALAMLAARAVDAWRSDAQGGRRRAAALAGLPIAATLALVAHPLARAWLRRVGASETVIAESARHALVALGVLAVAGLILWWRRGPLSTVFVAGLGLLQMLTALGGYAPLLSPRDAYPPVPLLARLQAESGPFRLIGTRGVLPPNASTFYRLADVRAHDPTQPVRYSEWLHDLLDVERGRHKRQYAGPRPEHLPYLRLLGVRFLLSGPDRRLAAPWIDRGLFRRTRLWELAGEVRWAFFPEAVIPVADAREARQRLRATGEPLRVATLELGGGAGGGAGAPERNGTGRVLRWVVDGDRLRIDTAVRADAWLVVSQLALPGWRAHAGGERLRTAVADGVLLAVRVPRGTRTVHLRYLPATWRVGCALSAASWLGGLALLLRGYRKPDPGRTA